MTKNALWIFIFLFIACTTGKKEYEKNLPFERKQAINDHWRFHKGDTLNAQNADFDDISWRIVNIPHDWAIEGPFSPQNASATGYLPGGIGWYRKKLSIPDYQKNRKYTLIFDGAYQNAEVWINGHYLGRRPYGYSSFYYDVSDFITSGEENVIAVKLDHSIVSDSRWYTGNGIYRNVWLQTTNKIHVDTWGTFVTTPTVLTDSALVAIQVSMRNDVNTPQTVEICSIVLNNEGVECGNVKRTVQLQAGKDSMLHFTHEIVNPRLWSPESPRMYTSEITVHTTDGVILDKYDTPFGIRSVKFTPDKGFFCNGKSYKLKGVCMHHDYGALGAARPPEAIYPVLKKLKEAGCNAIRTSHNPEDPQYLSMLDTMGFFVMEEAFDEFKRGKKKWTKGRNVGQNLGIKAYPEYYDRHGYSDFYEEWAQRDIQDMVRRDQNHPAIIMWSVGNETDYPNDPYQDPNVKSTFDPTLPKVDEITELVRDLKGWIKDLDTTRVVTQALANIPVTNAAGVPELLDVVGYNYQEIYYKQDHEKYPNRVIYGSENDDNADAWKAVRDNEFIAGQFLWTGMDYHGEAGMFKSHSFAGGLIDYCGFVKPAYYFRKSLWTDEPMVKLAVRQQSKWLQKMHWNWAAGDQLKVTCFTNCDEAELFLNGKSLGRKKLDDESLTIDWDVQYSSGNLVVHGFKNGDMKVSDKLVTAGKPAGLILKPTVVHSQQFNYDLIQIEVDMVDQDQVLVPTANSLVEFSLEGDGEILGVCNSDYESIESYQANIRKLYEGRCLVIVKANRLEGLVLKAKSFELNQVCNWHARL
jgi:beta-galactosidase